MPYRPTGRPPGRPPHPEPLTPAEQRVLDGVRRGLTNPAIAAELGVTADAVKYHVANMLSKLDLRDRHELAAWDPAAGHAPRRGRWALLAPLAAGLVGVTRAGLLVLALLRAARTDDHPSTSPTATTPPEAAPTTSASLTPTPAADAFAALRTRPLRLPVVSPDEVCPTTPGRDGVGPGPVFWQGSTQSLLGKPRRNSNLYRVSSAWEVDSGYGGPVLVRGARLDAAGQILFGRSGAELAFLANAVPALASLEVLTPGCYALQIDTFHATVVIVFEAVLESPPVFPTVSSVVSEAGGLAFTEAGGVFPRSHLAGITAGQGETPAGGIAPVWSPDGEVIASAGCFDDACGRLLLLHDRDGRPLESYEFGAPMCASHGVGDPAWSPDGTMVALAVRRCDRTGRSDIELFDAITRSRFLTEVHPAGRQRQWSPAWSPDGRWIAFTGESAGDADVCVTRPNGAGFRCLTDHVGFDGYARWSPDGRQILFESIRDERRGLWLLDFATGVERQLAAGGGSDWFGEWSPDGEWVVFSSDRAGDGSRIYKVRRDGRDITRLTSGPAHDWGPRWSPDGSAIAFLTNRDGQSEVYTVNAEGGELTRITTIGGGGVTYVTWVPEQR